MIVILLVGVAAGYLAGEIARGSGPGLIGDAAIGIVGALIGTGGAHVSATVGLRVRPAPILRARPRRTAGIRQAAI
jgi:uncharacterized membrane protein YeaQ/YmgE (transglycosylase-associated protein family)